MSRCAVRRGPARVVGCDDHGFGTRSGSRRRDRGAARGGQAALSQGTARSATAKREMAKAMRPRICCRGRETSRSASTRSGRLPNGALPTHQDLVNIIRRGMPYTSMPAWPDLTDQEVTNLAYFITTFSPDFSSPENAPEASRAPERAEIDERDHRGREEALRRYRLRRCHGALGRGDGQSAPTLKDDWGHPIRAANLAQSWTFRAGSSREDIFRTMSTGFNGTPMPSFSDSLSVEQRWAITDYIASLSGKRAWLFQPRGRQARLGADRRHQGGRELRLRSRVRAFRSSARSWSRVARSIRPRPA